MELLLEHEEAEELCLLLGQALADLSYEIADTDSWEFRRQLRHRRERLERIERQLAGEGGNASPQPRPGPPPQVPTRAPARGA
jgi:hypothetical protein